MNNLTITPVTIKASKGYRKVSRWRGKKLVFRKKVDLSKWRIMPVEDIQCYHSIDLEEFLSEQLSRNILNV